MEPISILSSVTTAFWTILTLFTRKVYVYVEIKYEGNDIKHNLVISNKSNTPVKIIKLIATPDTIGTKDGGINLTRSPIFHNKILEPNVPITFALDKKSLGDLKNEKTFQVLYKTRIFDKDINIVQKSNLHSYVPFDHRISLFSVHNQHYN